MSKNIQNIPLELDDFLNSYHNRFGKRMDVLSQFLVGNLNFVEEFGRWLQKEGINKSINEVLFE